MRPPRLRCAVLIAGSLTLLAGCPHRSGDGKLVEPPGPPCPAEAPAPPILPDEAPEHSLAEHWLTRGPAPDQVLFATARIEEHNQRMAGILGGDGWPIARWDLSTLRLEPARVRLRLRDRLDRLRRGVERGERVLADGSRPRAILEELERELDGLRPADEVRVAIHGTPMRCFPTPEAVYEKAWDLHFDLMQCAQLRYGEPVRVAARGRRFYYVWSTYGDGWVRPQDLSPPLARAETPAYLHPGRFAVVQSERLPIWADRERGQLLGVASFGLRLPLVASQVDRLAVRVPSPAGLVTGWILPALDEAPASMPADAASSPHSLGASIGYPRLTWASFLERAFRLLNTPYSWGGAGDKRDCSGLMMDLFAGFGLEIPRNTRHQALAGTRQLDVAALDDRAKAQAVEAEGRRGLVLLYMPGHIMLYLGQDRGQPYALHLFSGYLTPCKPKGETMQRVNRTVVTSLELGRGGSRRAFIQRITRLVVFDGSAPVRAVR